jgi:endonuclease IV
MTDTTDKIRLEVTSSAFHGEAGIDNFHACRAAAEENGFEFGIQLHNSALRDEVERIAGFGVKLSAHAPLLSEYNINLGAESFELSRQIIEENVKLFRKLNIHETVFHGFGMTDKPILAFDRNRAYDDCMKDIFRPELSIDGKSRMCCDFTGTEEYAERQDRVKERLEFLRENYQDILFCIENDFPAYGSANLFPENAARLNHPACLDTSHLWAVAHLFDRDFHGEVEKFLDMCDVKMVHVHASSYTSDVPKADWGDGHLPFSSPNQMDLPRFVQSCRDNGVRHYVLEIVAATPQDIITFADMWNS